MLFYPRLALNFHTSLHSQQLVFLHHDSTTAGHVPKSQRDNTNLQILLHFYIKDFFLTSFPEISKAQVNGESCISKESRYSDENTSCSSPDFLPKRPMDLVTSTPVNHLRTESDSSWSFLWSQAVNTSSYQHRLGWPIVIRFFHFAFQLRFLVKRWIVGVKCLLFFQYCRHCSKLHVLLFNGSLQEWGRWKRIRPISTTTSIPALQEGRKFI